MDEYCKYDYNSKKFIIEHLEMIKNKYTFDIFGEYYTVEDIQVYLDKKNYDIEDVYCKHLEGFGDTQILRTNIKGEKTMKVNELISLLKENGTDEDMIKVEINDVLFDIIQVQDTITNKRKKNILIGVYNVDV